MLSIEEKNNNNKMSDFHGHNENEYNEELDDDYIPSDQEDDDVELAKLDALLKVKKMIAKGSSKVGQQVLSDDEDPFFTKPQYDQQVSSSSDKRTTRGKDQQ